MGSVVLFVILWCYLLGAGTVGSFLLGYGCAIERPRREVIGTAIGGALLWPFLLVGIVAFPNDWRHRG